MSILRTCTVEIKLSDKTEEMNYHYILSAVLDLRNTLGIPMKTEKNVLISFPLLKKVH
jgi:hypothetical protein